MLEDHQFKINYGEETEVHPSNTAKYRGSKSEGSGPANPREDSFPTILNDSESSLKQSKLFSILE